MLANQEKIDRLIFSVLAHYMDMCVCVCVFYNSWEKNLNIEFFE